MKNKGVTFERKNKYININQNIAFIAKTTSTDQCFFCFFGATCFFSPFLDQLLNVWLLEVRLRAEQPQL